MIHLDTGVLPQQVYPPEGVTFTQLKSPTLTLAVVSMRILSGSKTVLNQERWFLLSSSSANRGGGLAHLGRIEQLKFERSSALLSVSDDTNVEFVYEDVSTLQSNSWTLGSRPVQEGTTVATYKGSGSPVYSTGPSATTDIYISAVLVGSSLRRIFWSFPMTSTTAQPIAFALADETNFQSATLPASGLGYYDGGFPVSTS